MIVIKTKLSEAENVNMIVTIIIIIVVVTGGGQCLVSFVLLARA